MGGGSKTQTTNSSQTRDPYAPAIPGLQTLVDASATAFKSGVGSQVYTGQRVAGLGSDTIAGMDAMKAGAAQSSGAAKAGDTYLGGLFENGGTTGAAKTALSGLMGVGPTDTSGIASAAARLSDPNGIVATTGAKLTGGAFATDTAPMAGLAGDLTRGPTQTRTSLQSTADGDFLNGSPLLDKIVNRSQAEAASAVAQKFAASGRYGSGRFSGAVADAVDNVGTNLRYTDLQNQQARQASAAAAIDSAENARASTANGLYQGIAGINQGNAGLVTTGANLSQGAAQAGLAGANALFSADTANNAQRIGQYGTALTSAQGDRAATMAGIGLQGTNNENLQAEGKTLAGVGAVQDAARQDQLTSDQGVFDETQASPWKQAGLYSAILDPIAGLGGTSTGTETRRIQENPGLLNSIIGGISGLTGSAANLGRAAPFLAMLSDERVKEDIQPVGALNDGQTVYSYRYKGDPTPQIGLLAQEVAHNSPDAVAVLPGSAGLMGVDYGRATARSAEMAQRYRGLAFQGAR